MKTRGLRDRVGRAQRRGVGRMAVRGAVVLIAALVQANAVAAEDAKAPCDPALAEQTARRVQTRYEGIRDLRARLVQTSRSATFQGEALMTAEPRRGRVVFAKPGRMRWTYDPPEASVVASDGKTLWIHDLEAKTVTRLAVAEGYLTGAALQFLMGEGKIVDSFRVSVAACDATTVSLDLLPKADQSYERLGLVADRATGDVVATSVTDLFGNQTTIRFEDLEANLAPPPETFVLKIPAGVEVIDYEGSATR